MWLFLQITGYLYLFEATEGTECPSSGDVTYNFYLGNNQLQQTGIEGEIASLYKSMNISKYIYS